MFIENIKDMNSIPYIAFEISFLKVCALSDMIVGLRRGGGDMAMDHNTLGLSKWVRA